MGGGIAGWLTPGWMFHEPRFAPHIKLQSKAEDPENGVDVDAMLAQAEDPKPDVIKQCAKHCTFWKDKLTRGETQLEHVIKINPTKTCLYPMRDYVTCVEACAQPLVHNRLEGARH